MKWHRSPSALLVFYHFQTRIQILLSLNTEESFVFSDAKSKTRGSAAQNFWNLILEATFSVALLQIVSFVVCHEMRAACSHRTCAFTAVFVGGFAHNGECAAAHASRFLMDKNRSSYKKTTWEAEQMGELQRESVSYEQANGIKKRQTNCVMQVSAMVHFLLFASLQRSR